VPPLADRLVLAAPNGFKPSASPAATIGRKRLGPGSRGGTKIIHGPLMRGD